jgi:hypothetical protein
VKYIILAISAIAFYAIDIFTWHQNPLLRPGTWIGLTLVAGLILWYRLRVWNDIVNRIATKVVQTFPDKTLTVRSNFWKSHIYLRIGDPE